MLSFSLEIMVVLLKMVDQFFGSYLPGVEITTMCRNPGYDVRFFIIFMNKTITKINEKRK